ncbi:GNAT family N-acetyltransferase [Hoeflea alexandrii]|uniref:GNAT family N-acetyltransferase n=1 Tax=Hoeflea alexandrii TaxID=288436 RepID=UPI0035D0BD2E
MDLRRASIEDRSRVELFQRAAYARTEAAVGARAIPLEWDYDLIFEQCEVWLDERDGVLAGVLILRVLEDELFLESIATAPDFAGTGCGRPMLEMTFSRAAALGLNRVGLITNSRNPALAWYGRMGFSVIHEEVEENRRIVHMTRPVSTLRASQG